MQRGTLSRTAGGERAGHQHTSEGQCRPSRCVSVPLSCWWPVSYSNHLITVTGLKLLTLKKPAAVWVTAPLSAQQSALRCSHWLCATQIRSICTFYMYHQHFHNVEHNNHITCTANEPTPGVYTWCVYLGHTASLFTSCFKQLLYKDLGEFLCCNRAADFKWDVVTFSRRVCGNLTRIKARCRDIFRLCLWQQTSLSQTLCQNKISSQF